MDTAIVTSSNKKAESVYLSTHRGYTILNFKIVSNENFTYF